MTLGPDSAHSPNAEDLNTLYWIALAVIAVLGIAINGALVAMTIRFRGERGTEPRRVRSGSRLQVMGAGILGTVALALFVLGVVYNESSTESLASGPNGLTGEDGKPQTLEVTATGQQWIWRYEYPAADASPSSENPTATTAPGTFAQTFTYEELVVPVDTAVRVSVESTDVIHKWWVPGLTNKIQATPGDVNETWFRADEEGVFEGASYQFSGPGYASMRTSIRVLSVPDYRAWLASHSADIKVAQDAVRARDAAEGGSK